MSRTEHSRRLAHARRLLAVQAAVGVVLGVVIVGAVTLTVVLSRQDADLGSQLARATAQPRVADPPSGGWLVTVSPGGVRHASPGAPSGLPRHDQVQAARSGGPVVEETAAGGNEYLTRTEWRAGTVVQAGVDFGPRDAERARLLLGLGIAGVVAAAAAAVVGLWLSRRAMAPLEEAMARQRRFVADASHELRTPLSRLTLRAQMLERDAAAAGVAGDFSADAGRLAAEARGMAAVVEDLLLSARLESSPVHGHLVDMRDVAGSVVTADQPRASASEVALTLGGRPAPSVRGVQVALSRAVGALVDNALSHAPRGGHVEVRVAPGPGATVQVVVSDDGPGLSPDDGERLFERFARGQHGNGRFGLGLALVREVVEAHGGSIRHDPAWTAGARFVLTLPAADPASDPAADPTAAGPQS